MTWEQFLEILDQAEYELMDGVGMQYHARTFTRDEYDTIKGVIAYVEKMGETKMRKWGLKNENQNHGD